MTVIAQPDSGLQQMERDGLEVAQFVAPAEEIVKQQEEQDKIDAQNQKSAEAAAEINAKITFGVYDAADYHSTPRASEPSTKVNADQAEEHPAGWKERGNSWGALNKDIVMNSKMAPLVDAENALEGFKEEAKAALSQRKTQQEHAKKMAQAKPPAPKLHPKAFREHKTFSSRIDPK